MNILFSWNDSVNSAPSNYDITDYKASIEAAGAQLDQLFSNINMTLTIDVGLGEVGGTPLVSGDIGEGGPAAGGWQTYDQAITDLKTHTTNPADLAQLATLPSVAPAGLSNIWVSAGEQKAWGLLDANSREPDGVMGFSSAYTYAPASDPGGPGYDLEGLAEHEITHAVFGRIGGSPMQLVDYTSPGVFAASGVAGYFSLDGGVTNLGEFSPADTSDWANGGANDAFDAAVTPATALSITPKDLEFLSWLGFDNTPAPPTPPTPPTPPVPPVITPPTPPVITPPTPPTPPAPPHPPTPPTPPVSRPPTPPTPPSPPTPPKAATNNFAVTDQSTGKSWLSPGTHYSGPVAGLTSEFIAVTPDNLNITATAPNTFISLDGGSGEDAIAVNKVNGNNVLNGSTGSSFLYGGTGNDTFFVDDRNPPAGSSIWSTVVGFHSGDAATVWGVTAGDFNLSWVNGQGAANYTGLTLHATAPGLPIASLTLAGLTSAYLTDGKLSISFGRTQDLPGLSGSNYMQIHAN